jgi:NAD kinase
VHVDYVITIGGDGTILALLRSLQEYEKSLFLPPIITFSQVTYIKFSSIKLGVIELPWQLRY